MIGKVHRHRDLDDEVLPPPSAPSRVVEHGNTEGTWAFLGLPLSHEERAELRLALAVRLPDLQQEQLMLLERVVGLMAGSASAARQWVPVRVPLHEQPAEPSA